AVTEQSQRTAGQSGVQKEFVENFLVLVPPLAEQKQIAAELSSKMANVETLEKSLKSQLEAINQLPSAILHKACNGQL
ncbi:MAG: restriction endonuclease subunit S, partial [Cuspidothrix sp.]